jgi:glycosyltransferase involved in cell wall biosynthesis
MNRAAGAQASAPTEVDPLAPPREQKVRAPRSRVLVLTVGFTIGGAEQLILMTVPRLQRLGFEVTVACLKGWGPLGEELEAQGVRAVALGASRTWDLRAAGRLLALIRRERIQVIHAHLFLANLAARLIGRLAGVPVVICTHHDTDLDMGLHQRLAERATASLSDTVVACSEAVRRYALRTYGLRPGQVRTLRNAIATAEPAIASTTRDAVRREIGAGPGDLLVGTVGRLVEPKKGIPVFLAAARRMADSLPTVRFVIVGDGPARAHLEALATREGVGHRTVFTGLRRDIPRVMHALDLFVQPSNWEGFGLTLLEAMSVGLPVVATRVGGVPEVVVDGGTGLLVPPADPAAMSRACLDLLSERERAARLGEAGRQRACSEFPIDRLVTETAELYRELLERRRRTQTDNASAGRGRIR